MLGKGGNLMEKDWLWFATAIIGAVALLCVTLLIEHDGAIMGRLSGILALTSGFLLLRVVYLLMQRRKDEK